MKKMELLKRIAADLKILASRIDELCFAIENDGQTSETVVIEKTSKDVNEHYDLEDVRGILSEKSRLGFTKEIKCILSEFGVSKLGDLDSKDYGTLLKKVEVLGNE